MFSFWILFLLPLVNSFTALSTKTNFQCNSKPKISTALKNSEQQEDNDNTHNEDNIDATRKKLESLLHKQQGENEDDNEHKNTPLISKIKNNFSLNNLSTESRKKLIAEMKLLQTLKESDSAVSVLWSFWFAECGIEEGKELVEIERLATGDNRDMSIAEDRFLNLIKKHGTTNWVEPTNRYATMLYNQERYEESKIMCENVLSVKPWHFGALAGIVLVCAALNDMVNAQIWSSRKLPSLNFPEKREEWVDRAISEIHNMLSEKETETIAGLNPDSFDDAWL